MSSVSVVAIQSAQADIDDVQTLLSAVQAGLERAEAAAEAVDEARRRPHLVVKLVVVAAVVAVIVLVMQRRRVTEEA